MDSIARALKKRFGFTSFRPHQEAIVRAILDGRDVFAALPTGGGKSLCYQLPATLLPGLTVVVSPLIALMQDQVYGATQNGLRATFLNSSLTPEEGKARWDRLRTGEIDLLYVSPERLALEGFRESIKNLGETSRIDLFAIDEAHCISEWGHEFRPDYRALSVLRREFPESRIAAFTATATAKVQADVIAQLGLREPYTVRGNFDRSEINYRVERKAGLTKQIRNFVAAHRGEAGIIYRATRRAVEETASDLASRGVKAAPYHAGLEAAVRERNQDRFVRDELTVVVATIAFGMGIDKPNVRWVLHADLPRSLEAYYQESGRAGRDGEAAEACLIYGAKDIATIQYHIDKMQVRAERERAERNLAEILRFVGSDVCRRTQLLAHFDQAHSGNCGNCDVCIDGLEQVDETVAAQKVMSAIARTGERFGAHHIADIVCGIDTERVRQFSHDRLPTFGVGADRRRDFWLSLLRDLEAAGLLRRPDGPRSGLTLTQPGRAVLFGKTAYLASIRAGVASVEAESSHAIRPAGGPSAPMDKELFDCLRALRKRLARAQDVPPYVVFGDKSLKAMARSRPTDLKGFLRVHGVGDRKAGRYGRAFLELIGAYLEGAGCTADEVALPAGPEG
jgi:ATP-dependent DNA helicase RecQ